jgi:GH25 family lysozyme M1 (1,4-beta-N-acetylmuramidase)
MDRRIFPDISNFTGRFEAHQAASAGGLLVGILATDGLGFMSPSYAQQAAHAHEAGLRVWHYHFARPEVNPRGNGEASHFWSTAKRHYRPGDRLSLDVERTHPRDTADGPALQLRAYIEHVDRQLHQVSGIHQVAYMPDSLFRACGPGLQVLSGDFWIASWGGNVARLGGRRRMVAQQISNGQEGFEPFRYPGIGACDTNRLQRWYLRQLLKSKR